MKRVQGSRVQSSSDVSLRREISAIDYPEE
jgi:hypothetical protein